MKSQLDDALAMQLQTENIRVLTEAEVNQKQLRYEWRKMLEQGYDADVKEHKMKKSEEREDRR